MLFSQSLVVILLMIVCSYLGYALLRSEDKVETLQLQLTKSLEQNQDLTEKLTQSSSDAMKANYEARIQDLKENQKK